MMLKRVFLSCVFAFVATKASAEEIYSFIQANCRLQQGFILDVEPTRILILGLDGRSAYVDREATANLVIHNVLVNPISKIYMDDALRARMQKVVIGGKRETMFVGWATRFVEDLVIFHDIDGKAHVVELDKVDKIRQPDRIENMYSREGAKPNLNYGDIISGCDSLRAGGAGGIIPTRILSDQIQISELLSDFQKGFDNVQSFRERTFLYAKPYMFEKETKLGIRLGSGHLVPSDAHIYYQWSTGSEYRFQSFNQFGTAITELGPTMDPLTVFRSDLKSHFFHASFLGNMAGLSAGDEAFDLGDIYKRGQKRKKLGHSAVSLNYMALMGADLGPWSISFGNYYPVFGMCAEDSNAQTAECRQVLADDVSMMFRLMYTAKNFQFRVAVAQTDYRTSRPTDDQIEIENDLDPSSVIDSFKMKAEFLRGGITYKMTENFEVMVEQIFNKGEFSENRAGGVTAGFDFSHMVTHLSLRHWFGRYVTLRIFGEIYQIKNDFRFPTTEKKENSTETNTGGVFEFVF